MATMHQRKRSYLLHDESPSSGDHVSRLQALQGDIVDRNDRLRELEERYEGYEVYDTAGDKIGKVDDLFIDETDHEEYIGVKLGLLGRKSTLIPMEIVRVNEADKTIKVSESKDHVKDAPSFDDDEDITGDYERRIREHFGLGATESFSASGGYRSYAGGETGDQDRDDAQDNSGQAGTAGPACPPRRPPPAAGGTDGPRGPNHR